MTTPDERTRAIVRTKAFLQELQVKHAVPEDVREAARALLRHYPTSGQIELAHMALPLFFGSAQLLSKKERK